MMLDNRRVGWMCSMVPEELIIAAGLKPERVVDIPDTRDHSSNYMPTNFCSLVRGYLDALLDNQGAKLDGVIITPACNATQFIYDAVKQAKVFEYLYMLDVPRRRDNMGVLFFANQLRQLASSLEDHFSTKITRESMLEAINLLNAIRKSLDQLKQARLQGLLSGAEFFEIVALTVNADKRHALKVLNQANESIVKRVSDSKKKILLIGSPLLFGATIDCIENAGGIVFLDDLCTSNTYLGTPVDTEGDLFENLAYSYLNARLCSRAETKFDRIEQIKGLLDKYSPDGVIYNLSKFRVTDCYDSVMLKEELFNENYPPLMVLENENTGNINLAVKTRVEAFMELLEERS